MSHRPPAAQPRRLPLLRLLLPVVILLFGCTPPRPTPLAIETFGLGNTLTPGSRAAFVAALPTDGNSAARADQPVTVELVQAGGNSQRVFEGRTDARGLVQVEFDVPTELEDPTAQVMISASSASGYVSTSVLVHVATVYDVQLTTDKPVYQPGQVLHMRALALARPGLAPAQGQPVVFTVSDPQGNKLLVEEVTTSDYGIAALDYPLDPRAASGDYTLEAALGAFRVSNTVEVKPYTLPRFEVTFDTARSYYLPGDVVTGTVTAAYFFGKPVAGGAVTLAGYLTDVERAQAVAVTGITDASGVYTFTFTLPEAFVADVIEDRRGQRTATLEMEIEVVDTANHAERIEEEVTVAEGRILIDVEAEAGALIEGVDNMVYVSTQSPDGAALQTALTITSEALAAPLTTTTDANGLAVVVVPGANTDTGAVRGHRFRIEAQAVSNPAIASARTAGLFVEDGLLLRPDLSEYAVGDEMLVDIYAPPGVETVFFSIEKNGESHALAPLPVGVNEEGQGVAQAAIELDGSLLGTLTLEAYARTAGGRDLRALRYVLVNPAPAELAIETGAETYRPGETATLGIQMTQNGAPLQGALGISIVDESVFALGESEPGFIRTYFLLARQMQEPRYAIEGFDEIGAGDPSPYDEGMTTFLAASARQADARQIALGGFFAQELAARPVPAPAAQVPVRSPLWDYLARAPLALPLLGLALYDGSRSRRRLLAGMLIAALASFVLVSCAAPAAPAAAPAGEAPAAEAAAAPADETTATRGEPAAPRLRQFFPETLLWLPEVETDADGRATIDLPLADTITTWRVSVVANDREGRLGSATAGLRVFQEFFVEPDLPTFLTVGDEVAVPVTLYNYLDQPQEVALSVEPADWYELTEEPALTVSLAANEVGVAYIPLRVLRFGTHAFQVTAQGENAADAVLREVTVVPNGEAAALVEDAVLQDGTRVTVQMPETSEPAASSISVRLYPGRLSRAVEGMKAMLAMPHGCFEQVTSVTYPNVLILDYLRRTGQANPVLEQMALGYIKSGYQQLLPYEVAGEPGGFSYWGDPPPLFWLTSYGLMEFSDMEGVSYVDPALIERVASYLRARQEVDGSWVNRDQYDGEMMRVETTAYVVWALASAGYADSPEVQRGLDYLRGALDLRPVVSAVAPPQPGSPLPAGVSGGSTQGMAPPGGAPPAPSLIRTDVDAYRLALTANALVAAGADATPLLDTLAQAAQWDAAETGLYWPAQGSTLTGAWEWAAGMETTALAAHAFLAAGHRPNIGQQALDYLLGQQDHYGYFGTTQATVYTLKALLAEADDTRDEPSTITITLDGDRAQTITLAPGQEEIVQIVRFEGVDQGPHALDIAIDGAAEPAAQIISEYYQPWSAAAGRPNEATELTIAYDRTELAVNESVRAVARVEYRAAARANMLLVELGVPPGFSVLTNDLDALADAGTIDRYEIERGRVLVYLGNVEAGSTIELPYRLVARVPVIALTPPSRAFNYYTPDRRDTDPPQRIVVRIRS